MQGDTVTMLTAIDTTSRQSLKKYLAKAALAIQKSTVWMAVTLRVQSHNVLRPPE